MIPIRDTNRSRHVPVMTWLLLIINVIVFLFENALGAEALNRFTFTFSIIPARLLDGQPLFFLSLFTSMFMHAGWFHLLSNMLTLYIFGDNVEDRMGPILFLLFYLLGGLVAGMLQTIINLNSIIPILGASGAIAGVLGAYMFLYPRARVTTIIFIFIFPWFVEIPAILYLGFWFVSQLFSGFSSIGAIAGGVAWWAHIGGFLFGLLLGKFFLFRPPPLPPSMYQFPDLDNYPDRNF